MTSEKDLVQSVLCAFGSWYNSSGRAERQLQRHIRLFNGTDLFLRQVELFTKEWHVFLPPAHSRLLQLGPILGFLAVCLVSPVILAQILTRPQMRQETRYLLLANALFGDLLFVSGYVLSTCLNTAGVLMSDWACATVLFLLGAVYSSGILSTQAMVLDTTVAVLVPLRYFALWPVSRTKRAVVVIWAVSVVFPAGSVGVFMWYNATAPCSLHICSLPLLLVLTVSHSTPMQISMLLTVAGIMLILLLVFVGYVVLHWRTRMARVWRGERSSRAKGTFLMHYLHLFLSFCPMLVLAIELLLYSHQGALNPQADLWVSLVVCNVLVMLPKVLAPIMYSLRYRELRGAVLSFYGLKKQAAVTPVNTE